MTRAFVICLGLAATLLTACSGAPRSARIEAFTASAERIPRNTEVTLSWQAADAGVQSGIPSCVLTRRNGNELTETPVQSTCAGSLTEVPPAPLTAAVVEYRFEVLKQPYDASDPYLSETRSVTLDAALYARSAGGAEADVALDVSNLADGGAIVTGYFGGTATFGAATLATAGLADVFVARIQPDGTWAWATGAGGIETDVALGVSNLTDGSAIVTGYFSGTATFGTHTLSSAGGTDAFVARIQPDGTWAWAMSAGGAATDLAYGVSALADGGAIVAGRFAGTADFGTMTLTSAGADDVFVARIQPDGTWAWATRGGGTSSESALGVSALPDGGAIVTGAFSGTATFGTTTVISSGPNDAFVARLHPDGAWAWAVSASGADYGAAYAAGALPDGSAIVTGFFQGTATFGATTLTSAGQDDGFVARVHPNGSWAWAKSAGGSIDDDEASAVSTLADGSAIVAGSFVGTATFGATTLTSASSNDSDVFVARLDPDGNWAWAERAGGGTVLPNGVGALADGGALVTGYFFGSATFGATTLTSALGFDVFIARIGADGAW